MRDFDAGWVIVSKVDSLQKDQCFSQTAKHVLSTYCEPRPGLDPGDTKRWIVNCPSLQGAHHLIGKVDIQFLWMRKMCYKSHDMEMWKGNANLLVGPGGFTFDWGFEGWIEVCLAKRKGEGISDRGVGMHKGFHEQAGHVLGLESHSVPREQEARETWEIFLSHHLPPFPYHPWLQGSLALKPPVAEGAVWNCVSLCTYVFLCLRFWPGPSRGGGRQPFAFGLFWQLCLPPYLFVVSTPCSLTACQWSFPQWQLYRNSP